MNMYCKKVTPLLLGVLLAWTTGAAKGAALFVAPTGSDTAPGTQTLPFRTIQRALARALAGDTITVAPGLYTERPSTVRNGRVCAPIVLNGAGAAVLKGGFLLSHDYITIDGFEITDGPSEQYKGAIHFEATADNCQILNNFIHDTLPNIWGIAFAFSVNPWDSAKNCVISNNIVRNSRFHMTSLYGVNHLLVNNTFDNSGGWDACRLFGRDHVFRGNLYTNINFISGVDNHTDLWQTFGDSGAASYNMLFERNYAIACDCQFMQLEQKGVPDIRDWTFRNNVFVRIGAQSNIDMPGFRAFNNTFYDCTRNTGHPLYWVDSTKGRAFRGECRNNAFILCGADPANNQVGWYKADLTLTDFIGDYNFVTGAGWAPKKTAATRVVNVFFEEHGINGGDPRLVSAVNNNFRPQSTSPLVNRGNPVSEFDIDFDGTARPVGAGWDIGAFEWSSSYVAWQPGSRLNR